VAAVAASLAGAAGLVVAVRASGSKRLARAVAWGLAAGCWGTEGFLLAWYALVHEVPWQWLLPLHLCDLALLLGPLALLTANRFLCELLYFWGIGGAVQALLQPLVTWGFPSVQCSCFFLAHAFIVASALYAPLVLRWRPTRWSVLRVWLATNAYALLVVAPVNWMLDTNYLFLHWKPRTPSLLDLMPPWPWYIPVLDLLALLVLALCYLPFRSGIRSGDVVPCGQEKDEP